MRVFIAGPLLDAQDLDLDFYKALGEVSSEIGLEPFVPHLGIDQDAGHSRIFRDDVEALRACDLLIADVSAPSHGVGGELMLAYLEKIPVICLAARGKKVSSMVQGNPMVKKLITYETRGDCFQSLRLHLQALKASE